MQESPHGPHRASSCHVPPFTAQCCFSPRAYLSTRKETWHSSGLGLPAKPHIEPSSLNRLTPTPNPSNGSLPTDTPVARKHGPGIFMSTLKSPVPATAQTQHAQAPTSLHVRDSKRVYLFNEGRKEDKALLGGKGANLAEMSNIGLPVVRARLGLCGNGGQRIVEQNA